MILHPQSRYTSSGSQGVTDSDCPCYTMSTCGNVIATPERVVHKLWWQNTFCLSQVSPLILQIFTLFSMEFSTVVVSVICGNFTASMVSAEFLNNFCKYTLWEFWWCSPFPWLTACAVFYKPNKQSWKRLSIVCHPIPIQRVVAKLTVFCVRFWGKNWCN